VNNQLKTIGDVLETLRRLLELIDNENSSPNLNISRENKGHGNNRNVETRQMRRLQGYPTSNENSEYRNRRDSHETEEGNELRKTRSEDIQTEPRNYNEERRTMSPKLYDRRNSGN
jgi:hypothetical protein